MCAIGFKKIITALGFSVAIVCSGSANYALAKADAVVVEAGDGQASRSSKNSASQKQVVIRSFTVADFSQYAPQNALDVINRIPGFAVAEEREQRGFGQASSNILINGARIAGKSNGIVESLNRIPVKSIVRLDIFEGASLGIPGLSGEVVDVIVKSQAFAGTWRWEMQHRDENDEVDPAYWKSNIAMSGKRGTTSWSLGLNNDYQRLGYGGPETVFDGVGNVLEARDEYATFDRDRSSISLGLVFDPASGNSGHVNLAYEQYWQGDLETRDSNLPGRDQRFEASDNEKSGEISGDYAFPVANGRLKLIAFQSFSRSPARSSRFETDTPLIDRSDNQRIDKIGESILRSEYNWIGANNTDWQWSIESALNTFDRSLRASNQGNLAFGIPAFDQQEANAKVEEQRFETNISYGLSLSEKLFLQSSLGIENSNLEQSGDVSQERNFTRQKGFIGFSYQHSAATNISFQLARNVGQLRFTDFIASVDLDSGDNNAGNPDLVPQQAWRAEISIDQNLQSWGALTLKLFGEEIEDIVDRIPTASGGDAVGNLDSAQRLGLEFSSIFQLTPLGWDGASFEIDAIYNRSKLDDPLTGKTRRISGELIHDITFELRHDVPRTDWAYGVSYRLERDADTFRLNQVATLRRNRGLAFPFIEHKDFFGLTARFKVRNIDDRNDQEERRFYAPRRDGMLRRIESRDRDFGRIYILELFGSF